MDDQSRFFNDQVPDADFLGFAPRANNVNPENPEPQGNGFQSNDSFYNSRSSLNTIDDWSREKDKYNTQVKIYNNLNMTLTNKTPEINSTLEIEPQNESSIEMLEEHKSWLESHKSCLGKKSSKLIDIMSALSPESEYFDPLAALEVKFANLEQKMISLSNKIRRKVTNFHKDQDITRKERLSLPKFKGDFIEFKKFKTQFTNFCKGMGSEDKKYHLVNALDEVPTSVIEPLVNADQDFDSIWSALVEHYTNPKEIADSVISNYLNTPTPSDSMAELGQHFIKMRNYASNILGLNMDLEQFLCHMYFLKIPGSFRSELESHLPKDQHIFRFKDIAPYVNQNVRVKRYRHDVNPSLTPISTNYAVTVTPGIVQGGKTGPPDQTYKNSQSGTKPKRRSSEPLICYICNKAGHKAGKCRTFRWGAEMRQQLQQLGRCDSCLLLEKDHSSSCRTISSSCDRCNNTGHINITCDGKPHPGSWILKSYQSNKPNSANTA